MGEVRKNLEALTEVQSKRQKLIGLGKKPNPPDDASLETLQLKNPTKFMMVAAPFFSVASCMLLSLCDPAHALPSIPMHRLLVPCMSSRPGRRDPPTRCTRHHSTQALKFGVTLTGLRQVGSVEKSILPDASALGDELPEVVNDLDWDFEPDEQTTDVGQSSENQAKLAEKVEPSSHSLPPPLPLAPSWSYEVLIATPPRPDPKDRGQDNQRSAPRQEAPRPRPRLHAPRLQGHRREHGRAQASVLRRVPDSGEQPRKPSSF